MEMTSGVLSNFPVVDVKATIFIGSFHQADSGQMSFKVAGFIGFKKGKKQAALCDFGTNNEIQQLVALKCFATIITSIILITPSLKIYI